MGPDSPIHRDSPVRAVLVRLGCAIGNKSVPRAVEACVQAPRGSQGSVA